MGTVFCNMAMSLDGYIARSNGDDAGLHTWVFGGTVPLTLGGMTFYITSEQSAEVFREFIYSVGYCTWETCVSSCRQSATFSAAEFRPVTHCSRGDGTGSSRQSKRHFCC